MPLGPQDIDFQALAAQAPVAWAVFDLRQQLVLGNAAFAEMFGYAMDDLPGLTIADLTHPDDWDRTERYLDNLVAGKIDRHETDKCYVRKDGSTFTGHLNAALVRDPDGVPQTIIGVIIDVTDDRALADRVAHSERRLTTMLTNISDTVTLVGPDGAIESTTGLHAAVMGYPQSFWNDRSIFDIVHPDDAERAAEVAAHVLSTPGCEVDDQFRLLDADGTPQDVELTAVNLLEDRAVGAVVLTTRNVTERNEAERALVEMRERALHLAEQRAGFVANVSHELRTPLHAVLGLAELLADSDLSDTQQAQVAGIRAEALHLRDTVDDLLDYARIEAEGITLQPAPVDISALVERVVARAASTEYATDLDVTGVVDTAVPPTVLLDEHRVEQLLTNLVGNAVKFTAAGHVSVAARCVDDRLELVVDDSGVGIPANYLDEVFEPFSQVPGTDSAVGGTGLGLTLVTGLVRLMGGTIQLQSTHGLGSTFTVRLPLVAASSVAADPDDEVVEGTAGASVLVVEDNEVNQLLIRGQLDRLGHRVTIVGTALDGIAIVEGDHDIEVVLMDWQLPDVDGLEATRRIRAFERRSGRDRIPVVAVTANAMPEDRAACRAAGMDDFLPKPVALADLDAMVRRWAVRLPVVEPVDAPEAFDPDPLAKLVDDLGDRSLVESLVDRYLGELAPRHESLQAALDSGDLETLHRVGHTLRSTSEMLGLPAMRDVCRSLEAAAADTDMTGLATVVDEAITNARFHLQKWKDNEETDR